MSIDDQVDLGKDDYSGKDSEGFGDLLSKPTQRPYQPLNVPSFQPPVQQIKPRAYEQPVVQPNTFFDELDIYDQAKKYHSQVKQYAGENERSAKHYEGLYDEFKKNKARPFFDQIGGFGEFENDDDFISSIDSMYDSALKKSQESDGIFGPSDQKIAAGESLKNFSAWREPNGLRDQMFRLKNERDRRRSTADAAKAEEYKVFESLTNIPIPAREALDQQLKQRKSTPSSNLLDDTTFEEPKYYGGTLINADRVDPRIKIPGLTKKSKAQQKYQGKRLEAARNGNISALMGRRKFTARERQLRDKGYMFSQNGLLDGRPIGLSRRDVDLLDIEKMKKVGVTSYMGKPLEQAMDELGGEERLKAAKIMQAVYAARDEKVNANLELIKVIGSKKAEKSREKLESARQKFQQIVGLAAENGLDNELFEQAETVGHLAGIGNAIKRGLKMSEMSNYTSDFLTNTLDADEMEKFIEIASEIEDIPTSTTLQRLKKTKSDGFLEAAGNLLFDNPAALPEMFFESLSAFLPATIKWLVPTTGAGAVTGAMVGGLPGALTGAGYGARASWGAASFVLEASGMALEGMQELGIDWKHPKVFAAAWTNESIRNKIQKKMVQKGVPIAIADTLTATMSGKVMAVANHTGNAMFKGGKLLNKAEFAKSKGAVPRWSTFQKTRNAAAELGFDSTMGMSGEYLGQWAAKEPGEAWDWDAVVAEGFVGVGPGVLSSALEMRSRNANYFGNAPIEITGQQKSQNGTSGTVTRAGYSAPYQTFNDADSMMAYFESFNIPGVDQETRERSLKFTRRWVNMMYKIRPEKMRNLKIAVSPRTPDSNLKNRGTFQSSEGHDLIYLNESEFSQNPMGALLHEAGHFARIMLYTDAELMSIWKGLKPEEQLDAYSQYYTKEYDKTFSQHDQNKQKEIEKAFNNTKSDVLAEEWFSYQFARTLDARYKPHPKVAKGSKNFADKILTPLFAEFTGTENVAGAKRGDDFVVNQDILRFMEDGLTPSAARAAGAAAIQLKALEQEYTDGLPNQKAVNENMRKRKRVMSDLERKLDAMNMTPRQKGRVAKAVNAMLGADMLSEKPSFYTGLTRQANLAASKEIDDEGRQTDLPLEVPRINKNELLTKRSEEDINQIDLLLPKTRGEEAIVDRLIGLQSENRDKMQDIESLDAEISRVITEEGGVEKKSGKYPTISGSLSVTGIIRKVLNLDELLETAPISLVSEIKNQMDDTLNRQKIPVAEDIENIILSARSRIESVKELVELRIAEINREIASLQPEAQIAASEIAELTSKKDLLTNYLDIIAPENMSIDWKSVPHSLLWFAPAVKKRVVENGKTVFKKVQKPGTKLTRIPLGAFAELKNFDQYVVKRTKGGGVEDFEEASRSPQEILWDFVTSEWKPPAREDKNQPKVYYGNLTQNQYAMMLEAVKASAMFPKQTDIATKPLLESRLKTDPDTGRKVEYARGYPSGYTWEKGANFGAVIAERIRSKSMLGIPKKDGSKTYPKVKLESPEPEVADIIALMMANGRTLELMGDPSDSIKDFDRGIFEIIREDMKIEMLGDDSGYLTSLDAMETDYAETDDESPNRIELEGSASITKTLAKIGGLKAKIKFQDEFLAATAEDMQSQIGNFQTSREGERPDLLGPSTETDIVQIKKFEAYLARIKAEGLTPEKIITNLEFTLKNFQEMVGRRSILKKELREEELSLTGEISNPQRKFVANFKVKPENTYNFRKPLQNSSDVISETDQHGQFSAGKIFETFDVLSSYAEGKVLAPNVNPSFREESELLQNLTEYREAISERNKLKKLLDSAKTQEEKQYFKDRLDALMGYIEELSLDEPELTDGPFKKFRTTIGKSETQPNRPLTGEGDLLSSVDVNAVDFVNWYLSGSENPVKQMEDLQMVPSSEVKGGLRKSLPGGLGEGLLPYVFKDFITSMYEKLNIKNSDVNPAYASQLGDDSFKWNFERGDFLINGSPVDFSLFKDEENRISPEVMADLAKPVVQAVLDAEGIDVYDQFEATTENLLQRDTTVISDVDQDAVEKSQREEDLEDALTAKPRAFENREKVTDDMLIELYSSNTTPVLRDAALTELVRRGVNVSYIVDENTPRDFDIVFRLEDNKPRKNRPLNADAGMGRRGFMKSMLMGFAAANIKTGAKVAGSAASTDWKSLGKAAGLVYRELEKAEKADQSFEEYILSDGKFGDVGDISDIIREAASYRNKLEIDLKHNKLFHDAQIAILKDKNLTRDEKIKKIDKLGYDYLIAGEFSGNYNTGLEKVERDSDDFTKLPDPNNYVTSIDQGEPTDSELILQIKDRYRYRETLTAEVIGERKAFLDDRIKFALSLSRGREGGLKKAVKYIAEAPSIFTLQALKTLFPKTPASSFKKLQSMPLKEAEQYVEKLLLENEKAQPGEINIQEEKAKDAVPRPLNADAGKPINDLNVVRKVIALTKKRIPFDRIAKLGSQWDYDELSKIHFKARDRSTYEGGKTDTQVAEELLKSLKSARAAMTEGDAERAQQETAFIEKLMSNDMVMNNKWSDIFGDDEAIDLEIEAQSFGGNIKDLITKARKFKKDGTSPRPLNSDAMLTSDVNPSLKKASLLARIAAGSEESKEEFKEWINSKKDSVKEGSFKMNVIDRASPLRQAHKKILEGFEAVGLDKTNELYKYLDVHGAYYRYHGLGDDAVQQSKLEYYEPMMELMREYSVDQEKVGRYLQARAAPSRNLQIEAKAREIMEDMEKDFIEDPKTGELRQTKEYARLKEFYFDGDTFIRYSGIETTQAIRMMKEMESDPKFVEFLNKFLPKYYSMNLSGLQDMQAAGMISIDAVNEKGEVVSPNEYEAMKAAMSRFDFTNGRPDKDGNSYKSKVTLSGDIGNYSYSPLQGFDGETENYFDKEEAWEEFGGGSNMSGKGFDQPKSEVFLKGAFGRKREKERESSSPNPETVLGTAFTQHFQNLIRAQKNNVSRQFGMMYGMLHSILYDKSKSETDANNEFFDAFNREDLSAMEKSNELVEAYDQLMKLKEPGNEEALNNLREEFELIFDKNGFQPTEEVFLYNKTSDSQNLGIMRRELSGIYKNDPLVFTFRNNGFPKFIKFAEKTEGMRMADTMKNLKYESLPALLQGMNIGTRLMANMFTSANLAFILPNFFRDVGTAFIHLTEDDKKSLVKDALNPKNLAGFMKEIYKVERTIQSGVNPNTQTQEFENLLKQGAQAVLKSGNRAAMYQYFKASGGKVGYFRHKNIPEQIKAIHRELEGKGGWTKYGWKQFWNIVDAMNTAVENSIRASTFWAAIKDGRSENEAATISRNVTVDFNQKGNLTQTFGAFYVFFGASVNSMHRFWTTFSRRTPGERAAVISGLAGAALIINMTNRLLDDDEDEEMPDYDTISSYRRDTNAILPVPAGMPGFFNDEKDTGYFSLPMPLGYNLFWTIGQIMGDMIAKNVFNRGGTGMIGGITRLKESALNSFNPIGGSSLIAAATPTVLTPIQELAANRNFMDKPIRYDDDRFDVKNPAYMQDPKSTPDHWTKLSKNINSFMGGDSVKKGSLQGLMGNNPLMYSSDEDVNFDISGNQMKHFFYGYLGGPAQIFDTLFGSALSTFSDKANSIKTVGDIPVFNRFMRASTYGVTTRSTYSDIRNAVKTAEKAAKKSINTAAYNAVLSDNRELLKLSSVIKTVDKQKNRLRRTRNSIEDTKTLSEKEKTQRVDDIQKKELDLMVKVIKQAQSLGIR